MKVLISLVIVAALADVTLTVPVAENHGVTYPIPWPTIKQNAIDYHKVIEFAFNVMRVLTMNTGPSGMLLSEKIIENHQRTNRVLAQVFDKIEQRSLNCDDVKHFSEEVIEIFVDVLNTLLESLDLSPELKARIKAIFAGTVLDSSRLINQVLTLLGCK